MNFSNPGLENPQTTWSSPSQVQSTKDVQNYADPTPYRARPVARKKAHIFIQNRKIEARQLIRISNGSYATLLAYLKKIFHCVTNEISV